MKEYTIYINGKPIGNALIVEPKPIVPKEQVEIPYLPKVYTGTIKLDIKPTKLMAISQYFSEMN